MARTSSDSHPAIRPQLVLRDQAGHRAGEDRFDLLAEIDRLGSIAAAAKQVGLSYKGAWEAVDALNNLFPRPVVVARPGGRHGGGAELTEVGRQALAAHRQLTRRLKEAFADLENLFAASGGPSTFNSLLWSLTTKTSARNCFYGTINDIRPGAVNSEVDLRLSDSISLAIIITIDSVANLGLQVGQPAFALIKASTPILVREEETGRTSARNRLCGTIKRVMPGAVNAEVVIDLGDDKSLAAIVTMESAASLGFKTGDRVCALIKASQIILGVD